MKRIITLVLALAMLASAAVLASCDKAAPAEDTTAAEKVEAKEVTVADMVKAVTDVLPFDGLVSDIITKEEDTDELIKWRYGMYEQVDMLEDIEDYAISLPTDYNQTLAIFKFKETPDADTVAALNETITHEYTKARASSLQMYMPEEYEKTKWALEDGAELVWKQFDNVIVLCIYDDAEHVQMAWDALSDLLG